jgi:hypothetical protein
MEPPMDADERQYELSAFIRVYRRFHFSMAGFFVVSVVPSWLFSWRPSG